MGPSLERNIAVRQRADKTDPAEDRRLRQQAAVHILKALGIYGKENFHPLGPTTPEAVEKEWEELDSWARLLGGRG